MQSSESTASNDNMDYDELTLNPLLAEIESEAMADGDGKIFKPRRYWTPKEEERFFEIWGRDNWRLTKHGKNTVFFAQWSAELKERFDIDVKAEEIQAKVNQTRAKFRQVKKTLAADKNATRWKKYDIIGKILKNQYRPKDAEPVPLEALESNRDFSSDELTRQPSPISITTSNSNTDDAHTLPESNSAAARAASLLDSEVELKSEIDLGEHNVSESMYNTTNSAQYNTELFSDDIKQEFEEEPKGPGTSEYSSSSYNNYSYQEHDRYGTTTTPNHQSTVPQVASEVEPQLHQLQTPQQHQQQMQQYQQYRPEPSASAPPAPTSSTTNATAHFSPHMPGYEHSPGNSYASNHTSSYSATNNAPGTTASAGATASYNHQYGNGGYAPAHNNTNMQPPVRAAPPPPRRRRGPALHSMNNMLVPAGGSTGYSPESLECQYLEEVRKKNVIMAEQKEIANKRLRLEERKVALLEEFFPKYLEMQQEILQKLNNNT